MYKKYKVYIQVMCTSIRRIRRSECIHTIFNYIHCTKLSDDVSRKVSLFITDDDFTEAASHKILCYIPHRNQYIYIYIE